jgi:hypothetical protein
MGLRFTKTAVINSATGVPIPTTGGISLDGSDSEWQGKRPGLDGSCTFDSPTGQTSLSDYQLSSACTPPPPNIEPTGMQIAAPSAADT